jgi:ABC-type nitrate/sulfonate/bicarbonate transport system permease component
MSVAGWAERLRVPISIGFVLAVWQVVFLAGIVPEKYFPSIFRVLQAFWEMLVAGDLLEGELKTFSRALVGLAGASLIGIVAAVVSDLSPAFGRGFRYVSDVLQPVPPAAFVPMAVFTLGLGPKLYAFVIVLVTVWPPYLNGVAALSSVSRVQLDTGRTLGCGKWDLLWHIKMPAALPEIFAGIRYAATVSLIAVIVSEMLAGRDGIGFMIFKKAFALRSADVFALMFVVAINGVLLNRIVNMARQLLAGWHLKMMERPA